MFSGVALGLYDCEYICNFTYCLPLRLYATQCIILSQVCSFTNVYLVFLIKSLLIIKVQLIVIFVTSEHAVKRVIVTDR